MKLSWFLLGLITGLTLTAFATPPVRKPKAQPIRGYRPPEPMARPVTGRVVVEKISPIDEIDERVREKFQQYQDGTLTFTQIIQNRKAAKEAYVR